MAALTWKALRLCADNHVQVRLIYQPHGESHPTIDDTLIPGILEDGETLFIGSLCELSPRADDTPMEQIAIKSGHLSLYFRGGELPVTLMPTKWAVPGLEATVEVTSRLTGPRTYAIRNPIRQCLNRDGEWEDEGFSSNRAEEFLARCRYTSLEDVEQAINTLLQAERTLIEEKLRHD